MKNLKVKVYIEWFNYTGKTQSKDLIATFCNRAWADHFVETVNYDDRFSRIVIEEDKKV